MSDRQTPIFNFLKRSPRNIEPITTNISHLKEKLAEFNHVDDNGKFEEDVATIGSKIDCTPKKRP